MLAVPIYQISRVQQAFAVEKANLGHLHSPEYRGFAGLLTFLDLPLLPDLVSTYK